MLPEFLLLFQETAQAPTFRNSLSGLLSVQEPCRDLLFFFSSVGPVFLAKLLFFLLLLLGLLLPPSSYAWLLSSRSEQLAALPSVASFPVFEAVFAFLRLLQARCLTSLPPPWVSGALLLESLLVSEQVPLPSFQPPISAFEGPLPDHSGRQGLMGLSPLW